MANGITDIKDCLELISFLDLCTIETFYARLNYVCLACPQVLRCSGDGEEAIRVLNSGAGAGAIGPKLISGTPSPPAKAVRLDD